MMGVIEEERVTKRQVKRSRRRYVLPRQFRVPIDPDEFKFCLLLGDAAGRQKMPMESPAARTITLEDTDGSTTTYRFADLPITRFMMAITQHYRELGLPDDERFSRVASVHNRIDAMIHVLRHPRGKPWVRVCEPCGRNKGETGIHDAVLHVAAGADLSSSGRFNPRSFYDLVEQIAESNGATPKPGEPPGSPA